MIDQSPLWLLSVLGLTYYRPLKLNVRPTGVQQVPVFSVVIVTFRQISV